MGTIIEVKGADYSGNSLNADFDIRSDHADDVNFSNGILSFRNTGASENFETVASSYIKSAAITMPSDSPIPTNAIVVGTTDDGNYAVMYLESVNSGNVFKFWKDGHVDLVRIHNMDANKPTVAKGSPVTVTLLDDRLIISYPGYTKTVFYFQIAGYDIPCIGVLATGNTANTYTFIVN